MEKITAIATAVTIAAIKGAPELRFMNAGPRYIADCTNPALQLAN
jgi:hypothetical protein